MRAGRLASFCVALALFWLLFAGGSKSAERHEDGAHLEVVMANAERSQGRILIDAVVSNVGEQALEEVVLQFDFQKADGGVVTRRQGKLDTPYLEPGDRGEFHAYLPDHPKAVRFVIRARAKKIGDLIVRNPGPFPVP